MSDNVTLTSNQRRALAALLAHPTITAAATACGLTERTLYRYMDLEPFRAALAGREGAIIDAATRRLLALAGDAVNVLRDVMNDPNASHYERLRAADLVLARLLQMRELRDVETRLAALEAATYGQTK